MFEMMIVAICYTAPHDCPTVLPRYEQSFPDWRSCQEAADKYNGISTIGLGTAQTLSTKTSRASCAEQTGKPSPDTEKGR